MFPSMNCYVFFSGRFFCMSPSFVILMHYPFWLNCNNCVFPSVDCVASFTRSFSASTSLAADFDLNSYWFPGAQDLTEPWVQTTFSAPMVITQFGVNGK